MSGNNDRLIYIQCTQCNRVYLQNENKKCSDCNSIIKISNIREEIIEQEEEVDSSEYQAVINQQIEQQNEIEKQSIVKAIPFNNTKQTDGIKQGGIMRLFYMNPRGFGPNKNEKIKMLKKRVNKKKIDERLFSAPDRRQNSIVLRKIKQ